jgi:hypothetical protein
MVLALPDFYKDVLYNDQAAVEVPFLSITNYPKANSFNIPFTDPRKSVTITRRAISPLMSCHRNFLAGLFCLLIHRKKLQGNLFKLQRVKAKRESSMPS